AAPSCSAAARIAARYRTVAIISLKVFCQPGARILSKSSGVASTGHSIRLSFSHGCSGVSVFGLRGLRGLRGGVVMGLCSLFKSRELAEVFAGSLFVGFVG